MSALHAPLLGAPAMATPLMLPLGSSGRRLGSAPRVARFSAESAAGRIRRAAITASSSSSSSQQQQQQQDPAPAAAHQAKSPQLAAAAAPGMSRRSMLAAVTLGIGLGHLVSEIDTGAGAGIGSGAGAVRGAAVAAVGSDRPMESYDEQRLLEQNRRIHRLNQAPDNFPGFIRQGFEVKVVTGPEYIVSPTGLIYWDIVDGQGEPPSSGQEVEFNYIGFNEAGRRVDSTYLQGRPAKTRVGINGMIPGFEEGISGMRAGGRRRIIIPPELGPPTGPSTFFSAKQYEVFDIELLAIRSCERRQIVFYSDVVCQ